MIGTKTEARYIYQWSLRRNGRAPKGWKTIGEGSYRIAYLSPGGVVYKISTTPYQNLRETAKYQEVKKNRFKGWSVAATYSHEFVVDGKDVAVNAQRYVAGRHDVYSHPDTERAFKALGVGDPHSGNYIVTARGKKIIDVQF